MVPKRVDPGGEVPLTVEWRALVLEEAELDYIGPTPLMGVRYPFHHGVVEAPVEEDLPGRLPPPLRIPSHRGVADDAKGNHLEGGFDEHQVEHLAETKIVSALHKFEWYIWRRSSP